MYARNGRIQFGRKLSPSGFAAPSTGSACKGAEIRKRATSSADPIVLVLSLLLLRSWVNLQHARNIGSIHAAPLIGYVRGPSEAKISPPREAESKTAAELCANLGWQKSKRERRLGVFAINFRPPAPT